MTTFTFKHTFGRHCSVFNKSPKKMKEKREGKKNDKKILLAEEKGVRNEKIKKKAKGWGKGGKRRKRKG